MTHILLALLGFGAICFSIGFILGINWVLVNGRVNRGEHDV